MAKKPRKLKQASNCGKEGCYKHTQFTINKFAVLRALANEHKIWLAVPESVQLVECPKRNVMSMETQAFVCQSCGIAFARNIEELDSRKNETTPMQVGRDKRC